jgi:hypothetical protein
MPTPDVKGLAHRCQPTLACSFGPAFASAKLNGMDEDREQRQYPYFLAITSCVLLMLLAYPLSIGPAAGLVERNEPSEPVVALLTALYKPIAILCEHNEASQHFFEWYIGLWL